MHSARGLAPALLNIGSMNPPGYPSAWLHPCRARLRFTRQVHCSSAAPCCSQLPACPSERSRSRGGRCRVGEVGSCGAHHQINLGSQGGPCDPSTKNHAGGTPASSLLRGYHTLLHPPCRKVRTTFQLLSGSLRPATHSQVSSLPLHQTEVVAGCGDDPSVRPAVF